MVSSGNRLLDESPGRGAEPDLLSVLALCGAGPFPIELLTETSLEGIASLKRDGLLVLDQDRVTVPPEVCARQRAEMSDKTREAALFSALGILDVAFPQDPDQPSSWAVAEELLPHVLAAIGHAQAAGGHDRTVVSLLDRAASFQMATGRLESALELARRATEAAAVGDNSAAGDTHHTLGRVLSELDHPKEARKHLERALQLHEGSLGPGANPTRDDRLALADVLLELGENKAADDILEPALVAASDPLVDEIACGIAAQHGWALFKKGELDEALAEYDRAIEGLEGLVGTDHHEVSGMRGGRGVLLTEAGKLDRARAELEGAISLQERTHGEGYWKTDGLRSALATVLEKQGDHRAALELLELALANGERILPRSHQLLWVRHRKLATTLTAMGRLDTALEHVEIARGITEQAENPDGRRLAGDLMSEADILQRLGRHGEARDRYEKARSLLAEIDSATIDLAACNVRLARTTLVLGDLSSARGGLEAALRTYLDAEGVERAPEWAHVTAVELARVSASMVEELAASCGALGQPDWARLLRARGRDAFVETLRGIVAAGGSEAAIAVAGAARNSVPALASEALIKAQSLTERSDGGKDSDLRRRVGGAWHRLGRACRAQGDPDQALTAFEAAVPLLDDHPQFQGVALHDAAEVREESAELADAISLYRQAVAKKRQGGENPGDLANTLVALGRALFEADEPESARGAFQEGQEVLDSLPEPDRWMEAVLLTGLAELESDQGRRDEAVRLLERAVEVASDENDPMLLTNVLIVLGRERFASGELDAALASYDERLRILSEQPERDLQAEGITLHDAADVHQARMELDKAITLYRDAAERKREAAEDPRDLAVTLLALAHALMSNKDYVGALAPLEERIEILRSLPERDLKGEAITLNETGTALRRSGRISEAISAYQEAEALERDLDDRPYLSVTLLALGRALNEANEHEAALAAYEERLSILKALPEGDPQGTGVTFHDIADVHRALGNIEVAADLYDQAAEQKRLVGDKPRDLAITLLSLGRSLKAIRKFEKSLAALDERLEILASLPEPDLRGEAITLVYIGEVLSSMDRSDEAIARYRSVTERLKKTGAAPSDLAGLLIGEANLHLGLSEGAAVRQLAAEAVEMLRADPGPDPEQLPSALMLAAEGALMVEDAEGAVTLFTEADRLLSSIATASRVNVAIVRRRLAKAHSLAGEDEQVQLQMGEARAALGEAFAAGIDDATMLPILAALSVDVESSNLTDQVVSRAREMHAADPADGHKRLLSEVLQAIGRGHEAAENYSAALAAYSEQLELLEAMAARDPEAEGHAHRDSGDTHHAEGRPNEAIAAYLRAAECFREAEKPFSVANALRIAAETRAETKQWDEAWKTLEDRLVVVRALPVDDRRTRFEAVTLKTMASVRLADGGIAEARELLLNAIALVEGLEADELELLAELWELSAQVLDSLENADDADEARRKAMSLRESL